MGMRTAPPGRGSESSTTRPLRTIEYVTIVREGRPGGVECLEAAAHRSRGPQRSGTKESKAPAALGRWYGGVVTPAPTPFCPDPGAGVTRGGGCAVRACDPPVECLSGGAARTDAAGPQFPVPLPSG